jgi:glycosyltransferase involved in cell wall biosynthesis
MGGPFFTIVVVSFNAAQTIRGTIDSVLTQGFQDYEIVVKDACSSDSTLEQIPADPRIRVYSTKDGGIYHGMNEAVSYAKGTYIQFLNCGDRFHDDTVLQKIWEKAKDLPTPSVVYGDYCRSGVTYKQAGTVTPFYLYRTPLCHQTEFIHRSLFEEGGYDVKYPILADHEFALRHFFLGVPFVYVPGPVCDYLGGGFSEAPSRIKQKFEESDALSRKYYSKKERFISELKIALSMRKLRMAMTSDKSPLWVRKAYGAMLRIVNR